MGTREFVLCPTPGTPAMPSACAHSCGTPRCALTQRHGCTHSHTHTHLAHVQCLGHTQVHNALRTHTPVCVMPSGVCAHTESSQPEGCVHTHTSDRFTVVHTCRAHTGWHRNDRKRRHTRVRAHTTRTHPQPAPLALSRSRPTPVPPPARARCRGPAAGAGGAGRSRSRSRSRPAR